MKTIKDILKADSIEQRRRIANNLAISREDKNALIANESNGGGGNGANIEYYKLIDPNVINDVIINLVAFSSCFLNCFYGESGSNLHNHSIANNILSGKSYNFKVLAIVFIDIKSIYDTGDGYPITFEGSLQERADYLCEMLGKPKININDYLEPITEEEFYNIKPE